MEKTAKRKRTTHIGLCTTCANDPRCTFQKMPGVPVRECLEFQGEGADNDGHPAETAAKPRREARARRSREPGLCPLCDKRLACTFPKQPGGIWLCEEFQ
jgi:hypothetical protein